ncbi:hypothetical protein SCALM49S_05510 [Streptomyces californicus]
MPPQVGAAAQHLDAAAAREVDVEEDDLGAGRRDDGDRLVDVGGLADHLDAGLLGAADLRLHPGAEHPVVVDEHDPYPSLRAPGGFGVLGHSLALSISSSTSVPPPGTERSRGGPAVALHPADD